MGFFFFSLIQMLSLMQKHESCWYLLKLIEVLCVCVCVSAEVSNHIWNVLLVHTLIERPWKGLQTPRLRLSYCFHSRASQSCREKATSIPVVLKWWDNNVLLIDLEWNIFSCHYLSIKLPQLIAQMSSWGIKNLLFPVPENLKKWNKQYQVTEKNDNNNIIPVHYANASHNAWW